MAPDKPHNLLVGTSMLDQQILPGQSHPFRKQVWLLLGGVSTETGKGR